MPSPQSGQPCNLVNPAAPKVAQDADKADPGEMEQVKADQRDAQTGKYGTPQSQTLKPGDKDPTVKTHWIEISLVDEDTGKPIPGEPYQITLPDGKVVPGTLDEKGVTRLDGIPDAGNCKITFPKLDKDAWKPK